MAVSQALSAFDFQPGDVLVTTRNDYTSNQIMYLALARRRGVEVLRADDLPEGGRRPRVGAAPRRPSALPAGVADLGADQLRPGAGRPRRWARSARTRACPTWSTPARRSARSRSTWSGCAATSWPARRASSCAARAGIGFLYVSDRALERGAYPLGVDMRGAGLHDEDGFELAAGARRFENWEFPYALVLGLGEAARYALRGGDRDRRAARALGLAAYIRERLRALPGRRASTTAARASAPSSPRRWPGWDATDAGAPAARRRGSTPAPRRSEDGSPGRRWSAISPHYYNTREEIDAAVDAIEGCCAQGGEAAMTERPPPVVRVRRVEGAPVVAVRLLVRAGGAGGADPRARPCSPAACSPRAPGGATGGASPTRPRARG